MHERLPLIAVALLTIGAATAAPKPEPKPIPQEVCTAAIQALRSADAVCLLVDTRVDPRHGLRYTCFDKKMQTFLVVRTKGDQS